MQISPSPIDEPVDYRLRQRVEEAFGGEKDLHGGENALGQGSFPPAPLPVARSTSPASGPTREKPGRNCCRFPIASTNDARGAWPASREPAANRDRTRRATEYCHVETGSAFRTRPTRSARRAAAPRIGVTLFGYSPHTLLAPGRVLSGNQADPRRQFATGFEDRGIRHRADKRGGDNRPDTGNGLQAAARLARTMPDVDAPFIAGNFPLHRRQRSDQTLQTALRKNWKSRILPIGDNREQSRYPASAHGRHDAKLGQMRTDLRSGPRCLSVKTDAA